MIYFDKNLSGEVNFLSFRHKNIYYRAEHFANGLKLVIFDFLNLGYLLKKFSNSTDKFVKQIILTCKVWKV